MASRDRSRDQTKRRTNNSISTKRIFTVNKDQGNTPKSAQIETPKTTINSTAKGSSSKHRTGSHKVSSSTQQIGPQNQSINQNYSSRNSLRTAQSVAIIKNNTETRCIIPTKMPIFPERNDVTIEKGIEDTSNYEILSSGLFLRVIDENTVVCFLCGRKEKMWDSVGSTVCDSHLRSEQHNEMYRKLRFSLLDQIPSDTSLQMNAIRELLSKWYNTQSLTQNLIATRMFIIEEFNGILGMINPECRCRPIGSYFTGTSLITSDINLELIHPNTGLFETDPRAKNSIHHKLIDPNADYGEQINNHTMHYDLIPNPIDTLYKTRNAIINGYVTNHSFKVLSSLNDLNGKIPKLVLMHLVSNTELEISCYADSSHKLSVLLQTYLNLDDRARTLSILVKYWAKICRIDNPDLGTLPPDAFIILVIYYLQRTSPPVLPCLHEVISRGSRPSETSKEPENELTQRFHNLGIQNDSNNIFNEEINELLNGQKNSEIEPTETLLDNDVEAGEDEIEDEEEEDGEYIGGDNEDIKNMNWHSDNNIPVHKLFVDFLRFMIKECENWQNVITIRTLRKTSLPRKGWGTQVKAIENPIKPRTNISRCIGNIRIFDYIRRCFRHSLLYLTSLPVNRERIKRDNQPDPGDFIEFYINYRRLISYFKMKEPLIRKKSSYDPIVEMIQQNHFSRDIEVINILFDQSSNLNILPKTVANFYNEDLLASRDIHCTIFCWLCKKTGHHRKTCPSGELERIQLEDYGSDLDDNANFDDTFLQLYNRDKITTKLSELHQVVIDELSHAINSSTDLKCQLQLFGSTVNNLGSWDSDLDICMTLEGNPTGKDVDCVEILQRVHKVLVNVDKITSVEPILAARVPIIKFKFDSPRQVFDIDLSMYNQCATYNSRLLKAYSLIDVRVSQLFYLVKRYAKACNIADASKGSLSSYAWSLMVIHYLQHTNPPILPVLQETRTATKPTTFGVNGWNVWFDEDFRSSSMARNYSSLTELFKKFFIYYANFDFNFYVVSIRKSSVITRFQKNWNNCMIAIEDPFELTYNLSSRLDDPMAIYVINSFAQAYRHIVRTQEIYIRQQREDQKLNLTKRMFNGKDITIRDPPYRGCRICHKIGHKLKDCPEKRRKSNHPNTNRFRNGRGS